jgi:nickel/cobalt exporter
MTELGLAFVTAFALGAQHALEVDHMVAVTAFVGGNPRFGAAIGFGVRWGLGHSLVVLIVGAALALSGLRIPGSVQDWAELGVGVMLVALGVWAGRVARRLHVHPPPSHGDHAHLHAHASGARPHVHEHASQSSHRHGHLSTMVGAFHGLAGTAPIVAIIPVTLMPSKTAAIAYLASFGIGTVLAMGVYAGLAALAANRLATSGQVARVIALVTAGASLVVGLWWIGAGVVTLRR